MAKITVKKYMVQVYAKLIMAGNATMVKDNQEGLRYIPEAYHEAVAEWLAEYEDRNNE